MVLTVSFGLSLLSFVTEAVQPLFKIDWPRSQSRKSVCSMSARLIESVSMEIRPIITGDCDWNKASGIAEAF